MSKEILKQLKVGDKVWAEVYVISEMDKQGDIQVEGYSYEVKDSMFLNHTNNFSLSNPNEQLKREFKVGDWVVWEGEGEGILKKGGVYKVIGVDKLVVTVSTNGSAFSAYYTEFSLSTPNELTVRELCEWIKDKGSYKVNNNIKLWDDCCGGSDDGVIDFNSLEHLTELVREPNFQRKEEIRKQIEELKKELNKL